VGEVLPLDNKIKEERKRRKEKILIHSKERGGKRAHNGALNRLTDAKGRRGDGQRWR